MGPPIPRTSQPCLGSERLPPPRTRKKNQIQPGSINLPYKNANRFTSARSVCTVRWVRYNGPTTGFLVWKAFRCPFRMEKSGRSVDRAADTYETCRLRNVDTQGSPESCRRKLSAFFRRRKGNHGLGLTGRCMRILLTNRVLRSFPRPGSNTERKNRPRRQVIGARRTSVPSRPKSGHRSPRSV